MSRCRVALCALVCLLLGGFAGGTFGGALGVAVDTPTIDRFDQTTIQIVIFGLTGSEAHVRLLRDIDGDGQIDPGDIPVWSTVIVDNLPPWSPNMPTDTSGTGGTIIADLRVFGALGYPHSAGSYIWQAEDPGVNSVTTPSFTVTENPEVETVSGQVIETGSGTPIPGALVALLPVSEDCSDVELSAFADAGGNFTINVPAGILCRYRVAAGVAPGYLTNFLGLPSFVLDGSPVSGVTIELDPATHVASGTVNYADGPRAGLGVPGQLVVAEADGEAPALTFGWVDADGSFELTVNDGDWFAVVDNDLQLALAGAVGKEDSGIGFNVAGGPEVIPTLEVPTANAFIRGTLRDEVLAPVVGRTIEAGTDYPCDPDCYSTAAITANDGTFSLGVVAPAGPDTASWTAGPEVPLEDLVARSIVVSVSAGNDLAGNDIDHFTPTNFITGEFSDTAGNPVGDLCVWGETFGPDRYVARARVGCDGTYSLPVLDGNWDVSVEPGDLAGFVRNIDPSEISAQFVIAGSDEQGDLIFGPSPFNPSIARLFPEAATAGEHVLIEGINFMFGNDPPTVSVDGVAATVVAVRQDIGRLVFEMPSAVPDGPVQVRIEEASTGFTSNEACMEKVAGTFASTCNITGNVTINAGAVAVEGVTVVALNEADESLARVATTDSNGGYDLDLGDDMANYTLLFIPPAHTFRVWGERSGIACPAVLDHNIRTGRTLSGRVVDGDGDGIANVFVNAGGALAEASVLTDDGGNWTMRLWEDDTVGIEFLAPLGSRWINDQWAEVVMSGAVVLPDVELSTGFLFLGRVVDAGGAGISAGIDADGVMSGGPSGRSISDTCTGAFSLALAPGQHGLRLETETSQEQTHVQWLDVDGDTVAEFDFTVFDDEILQFTGPEPRINDQSDFRAQVGQPIVIGVENLGPTNVEAVFAGELPGVGTGWDPARGIVVTRVPASAVSGDLRVDVDGTPTAPIPFTVEAGAYDSGAFTMAGIVTDGGSPVAGAVVLAFAQSSDGCDDDDVNLHEFDVTDAGGGYSVQHPGGTVFLLVMPPAATGLALSAQEFTDENADRLDNDVALVTGATLSVRVVAGNPPAPVPNAFVLAEGNYLDMRITDANGDASFQLPPGPVDLELNGPLGSRLLLAEVSTLAPNSLGDIPLASGVMTSGRVTEDDGTPLVGLETDGFSTMGDLSYFFGYTRENGVWTGPVAANEPFGVFVESGRDDLADLSIQHDASAGDLIHYPTEILDPAGTISGSVLDAEGGTPLPGVGIGAFFDEGGFPGSFSAGGGTCNDGTYSIKVPGGTHFIGAFPGFEFPDLLEGYHSPATTGDFCSLDAESVVVAVGVDTPGIDVALDIRSIISGRVAVFDAGEPNVQVTATLGRLGTCEAANFTGPDGGYSIEVPAATGYRVEAQSPPSIGGPSQCFAGFDDCVSFDPVTAEPLMATTGIDFLFGFPPPEVSETFPPLSVAPAGGDDVTLTFEALPPEVRGDAYNLYTGSLGDFGTADTALCLQLPGTLIDNFDGTFSKTLTAVDGWFLVSASNVIAEGPLGAGRTLTNPCGAVPPAKRGAPAVLPVGAPKQGPAGRQPHRPWQRRVRIGS